MAYGFAVLCSIVAASVVAAAPPVRIEPELPTTSVDGGPTCRDVMGKAKFEVYLDHVAVPRVLAQLATAACRPLIVREPLRGSVNLIAPRVNARTLVAAFVAVLWDQQITVLAHADSFELAPFGSRDRVQRLSFAELGAAEGTVARTVPLHLLTVKEASELVADATSGGELPLEGPEPSEVDATDHVTLVAERAVIGRLVELIRRNDGPMQVSGMKPVDASQIRKKADDFYEAPRATGEAALANLAGLVVANVDLRPEGFVIRTVRRGSIFEALELLPGDVVTQINGYPLTDPDRLRSLYLHLRQWPRVELAIVRNGEPVKKTCIVRSP